MRRICEILKKKDVGVVGIGAMIVFIAMVLVAGIAASVLVQTANNLEIQAMQTGRETTAEVATGLRVVDIEGEWTQSWNVSGQFFNDTLANMTITVAPRAGSADVDLDEVVIEISDSNVKCILAWTDGGGVHEDAVVNGGVFSTPAFDVGPDEFGIIVLEDADSSCGATTPVINRGDKVMLTINLTACFGGLAVRTDITGRVIPEEGYAGAFAFRTPASYAYRVYDLY